MSLEIENYIESQYRKIFDGTSYEQIDHEFAFLYENVGHTKLRQIFTVLHSEFNAIFDTLNQRLPTGETEAHFWAEPSRELIYRIRIVRNLQRNLFDTIYAFELDEYYEKIVADCESWLSDSGGSKIPPHHQEVILYYVKPIFLLKNNIPFSSELHVLGSKENLLGRGGFSEVYKYHHPIIDIDFAVKVLNTRFADDPVEAEKRFFREAKMLFSLNHSGIVRVYDVGRLKGNPFIKMEYIDGGNLDDLRRNHGNFTYNEAAGAMESLLKGLHYAHEQGIIHRDLKPSNVMVDKRSDKWKCKIIDFGISAFMEDNGYTKLTRTGESIAGGHFIDPLLMQDQKMRDRRSDVYSAGAIMFFLLSGHPPAGDAERFLRESNSKLNSEQIAAVMKSLSQRINERYSTCIDMLNTIISLRND